MNKQTSEWIENKATLLHYLAVCCLWIISFFLAIAFKDSGGKMPQP